MRQDCLLCAAQKAELWFLRSAPSAAALKLGINERFRAAILLAAQRTGLDPAGIAAVINAEAAPISDRKLREKLVDEAFRGVYPGRDWDRQPLDAKRAADAPFIKAWKQLYASTAWDEKSYNAVSSASGLTQFTNSTWKLEARRRGTYLNDFAKKNGYLDGQGDIVPSRLKELLDLRFNATLAIVAAAEYDKRSFDDLCEKTIKEPKAVDKVLFAKYPQRDFVKQPLGSLKDGELIKEWKQLSSAQSGKPLVPRGLTDDQKARYLYLCHHEGFEGAVQILSGSLTDLRAKELLKYNVPEQSRQDALVKEHGSLSKAYIQWLWRYIDQHIQPSGFRQ